MFARENSPTKQSEEPGKGLPESVYVMLYEPIGGDGPVFPGKLMAVIVLNGPK